MPSHFFVFGTWVSEITVGIDAEPAFPAEEEPRFIKAIFQANARF